ncbi:hypothetical protein N825_25270 [Skermanella stibiiresistens SB22]|uniref:LexA repressor DNA-binding domain-containing protein n=1 Tax=Skermanella stibiiresistens SB22 TaxID=1385369 RepID=W9GWC9_9PROT|nr:hypothetical protein [Skermanella stibiiresistens]EWY36747.1 hypothetical protein N825_25270 [Skermanella stibiiresistens SB22]
MTPQAATTIANAARPTATPTAQRPDPLTPRQLEVLRIIVEWTDIHHVAPSLKELAWELDTSSAANAMRLLATLVKKGWISRTPFSARAIQVLHRPPPLPDCEWEFHSSPDFLPPELAAEFLAMAGL